MRVRIGLRNVGEGVAIAFDSLRANKLRSGLTILGVVIGVTTVMAMASMVQGIRTQIFNAIETAGPSVFYVVRYLLPDAAQSRQPARTRCGSARSCNAPTPTAIARLPQIAYAGMWVQMFQRMEYQGDRHPDDHASSAPTTTTWTSRAARCSGAASSPAGS